jgi:5'-3' exonuclease
VDLLEPDRVAVVFDGQRSWESRRQLIAKARRIAAPRAELLSAAGKALRAEAEALSQAAAAVAVSDYARSRVEIESARQAAHEVQRVVDELAGMTTEHAAFVEEIFGKLETPIGNKNGGEYMTAAEAVYSAIELELVRCELSEAGLFRLQEQEVLSRRYSQAFRAEADSAKRLAEDFPPYKGNRPGTPELVATVLQEAPSLIRALGWPTFQVDGIEADDVIGQILTLCCNPSSADGLGALEGCSSSTTAAVAATDTRPSVIPSILSKDKDFTQLLADCSNLELHRPRHHRDADGQGDAFHRIETLRAEDIPEK